ncbi:MAG TPA: efflux transporter outer membrane subunit [Gemmatimonadales bacterium]|jgi:multidrug efflux system outer membrane protein|nr:efflux transporter outer membrane subunit [Gemmatimonadales bacterium]
MRRRLLIVSTIALAGCAVGPSYRRPDPVPPATAVGAGVVPPATRAFFDSLAAARSRDTLPPDSAGAPAGARVAPITTIPLRADPAADLAWLDVLRDSTLTGLVRTALADNRDLRTAAARVREYRALVGVARGPLFPSLSANGSASTSKVALGGGEPIKFDALRVTGDLAWEIDFWGRIRRGIEAAGADLGAQEAAERATVLSLVSSVATSYLQLLELDQERLVAERTLASRQATLQLARRRYAQGLISELDVRQFEAQLSAPAVTLAQVERLRAETAHQLDVLLGRTPVEIAPDTTRALTAAVAALEVPDSLPGALVNRRPDVQQAERALAAATARIGVAQAARLPTITVVGSYGTQAGSTNGLFKANGEVYQLQGGISFPLFTGGRLVNQSRAAVARADEARAQYEQTALNALREAGDALVGARTARDEVTAQATQAQALRRATQLAELRYRTGIASYVEVLQSQRDLFAAELALSQAQLRQLTAAVELYRALGGSWRQ